jgi:uncharacterized RDD family membrane protein YckC
MTNNANNRCICRVPLLAASRGTINRKEPAGMAKGQQQLDLRIEVQTPENIAFQYRVAGPFRRLPAYLVDVIVRSLLAAGVIVLFLMMFGSVGLGGLGVGLGLTFWFVMSWFYGGLFETFWNGQTPGKRMHGLRVVCVDGRPINGLQAVLRNILRTADSLPVVPLPMSGVPIPILPMYLVGLITPLFNARYQRLGDLVCGTMVIVEEKQYGAAMIAMKDSEAIELAAQLPPNLQVSRSLGRALVKYVSRRNAFSRERRAEIARRLGDALTEQYSLPRHPSYDLLLCALYYRTFIADHREAAALNPQPRNLNPAVA